MSPKKGPTLRRRRQRKRLVAKLRPFGNRHKRYWKVLDRVRANPTGAHAMRELAALTARRRRERIFGRVFVAVAALLWIVAAVLLF